MKKIEVSRGDKAALLQVLAACAKSDDTEGAHGDADDALVSFIGDDEVTAAYEAVDKWYA